MGIGYENSPSLAGVIWERSRCVFNDDGTINAISVFFLEMRVPKRGTAGISFEIIAHTRLGSIGHWFCPGNLSEYGVLRWWIPCQ